MHLPFASTTRARDFFSFAMRVSTTAKELSKCHELIKFSAGRPTARHEADRKVSVRNHSNHFVLVVHDWHKADIAMLSGLSGLACCKYELSDWRRCRGLYVKPRPARDCQSPPNQSLSQKRGWQLLRQRSQRERPWWLRHQLHGPSLHPPAVPSLTIPLPGAGCSQYCSDPETQEMEEELSHVLR